MYAGPSEADLGDLVEVLQEVIDQGTPAQRKALLRGLVVDIRVKSREAIHPTFRLPAGPGRVTDQPLRVRLPLAGPSGTVCKPRSRDRSGPDRPQRLGRTDRALA